MRLAAILTTIGVGTVALSVAAGGAPPARVPPPLPEGPPSLPPSVPPAPVTPAPVTPAPVTPAPATPAGGAAPAVPADGPPSAGALRTIAVVPFDAALGSYVFGTPPAQPSGDCGTVSRPGAEVAKRCTQELVESMVATRRFRVVDRDTVDRILQEQGFHRTQGMDPKELSRLGRLLGADRLVVGTIELAGTSCRRVEVRASGYLRFEFSGGIELTYRVLDVATGEIAAIGRLTRTWDTRPMPDLRGVLSNPESALAFFARQAAQAETFAVLDAIDPVRVAALDEGAVVLNQGRGRPMSPGMTLRVLRTVPPIRDPATGAVLSEEGAEIAVIQVFEVGDRVSRARVVSGNAAAIPVGATCRWIEVPPAPGG